MAYESNLARRLVPYKAGEQPKEQRLIKLNTNENPYPPAPGVAEALRDFDAAQLRLYPDMETTALRQAIAQVEGVPEDWVFCGNGSDEVLAFAFAAFFAEKTLCVPAVTYSFYPVYANLFGTTVEAVPMLPDWQVDVQGLMQEGPVALANPNAPTGLALPMAQLRRLAEYTRKNAEVLLVDEAYAAFAEETAVPLVREFDNVLLTRTFSKSHALAGLRVGYAIGQPGLIAALRRIRDSFNSYPVDRVAQAAARAAVLDTAYTAERVAQICRDRDACYRALQEAGIEVLRSRTNFLFVRAAAEDAAPVQQRLRQEGILVRHFATDKLRPYLRVTIGTTEEMGRVTEALIRNIKGNPA